MDLNRFFPYRVAVLAEAVSRSVSQVYAERFDLSRDEWRVLAALAQVGRMKMVRLVEHTTLDKMQVSRAVARLESGGLLVREPDPEDRRGWVLHLTTAGRNLHRKIVPMVQARESFLLDALEPAERAALEAALDKVLARARQLAEHG